jgi:hypothetical protein
MDRDPMPCHAPALSLSSSCNAQRSSPKSRRQVVDRHAFGPRVDQENEHGDVVALELHRCARPRRFERLHDPGRRREVAEVVEQCLDR